MHRSELLAGLMQGKISLLVAGTHGKTTTTSLLTHTLLSAGINTGYAIGGVLPDLGVNASAGGGSHFVAEADESDGSFLRYEGSGAIITNIDLDHMSHFGSEENLVQSFAQFASQVKNRDLLFYCGEDARLKTLKLPGISYGFEEGCSLRGSGFKQNGFSVTFDAEFKGKTYQGISFSLPGRHSALNALAVFGMGLQLGIPEKSLRSALASFSGVKRRSESKACLPHLSIYDDYGHHPTEIAATLKAFKEAFPDRRLLVYFQPHRYTRTQECLEQFGSCFDAADEVVLTEIYSAGEAPIAGIKTEQIQNVIKRQSSVPNFIVSRDALFEDACRRIRPFDIVLTLGAGDITKLSSELAGYFLHNAPKKLQLALIYGGKSSEHEISLLSARNIAKELNPKIYDLKLFYIAQDGGWHFQEKIDQQRGAPVSFDALLKCDAAFPILHGPNGEDGTVQGFFKIMGIPYAGCSTLPSAIAMHKGITKQLVERAGVSVSPFLTCTENSPEVIEKILSSLTFPLFVKPVRLGSTIGVKKVIDRKNLLHALEEGLKLDHELIIEEEVKGREIEFAVMGGKHPVVLPPGEIKTEGRIYGFEEKYKLPDIQTSARAELSQDLVEKGCLLAKKAYEAIGGDGFARVDFFLKQDGTYILNEINPIPGFTSTSLYPEMCRANGLEVSEVLDYLVRLGLERKRREERKGI